jgi:hypothetical protein
MGLLLLLLGRPPEAALWYVQVLGVIVWRMFGYTYEVGHINLLFSFFFKVLVGLDDQTVFD